MRHIFALYDDLVSPSLLQAQNKAITVTIFMPWNTSEVVDAVSNEAIPFVYNGTHTSVEILVPFRSGKWLRSVDAL